MTDQQKELLVGAPLLGSRLNAEVLNKEISKNINSKVYVCGPPTFNKMVINYMQDYLPDK